MNDFSYSRLETASQLEAPLHAPDRAYHPETILVHELIARTSARQPSATAIVAANETLTYAELQRGANNLANYLQSLGVGPDVIVGVCLPRSPLLTLAALSILNAGGAYLPIDPCIPPERLSLMLNDSKAFVVITNSQLAQRIPPGKWSTIALDEKWAAINQQTSAPRAGTVGPENLAYVIYTSGSTGTPKGVAMTHANLQNLISWHNRAFGVSSADRASQLAHLGFDASVWETWPYLTAGALLELVEDENRNSAEALRDWLVAKRVTISFVPTPLAEQLLGLDWPAETELRLLLTGGDTLHIYPSSQLPFVVINNYGPTECTVVATSGVVPAARAAGQILPSIGKPIDNTTVHILDDNLQPVTPGSIGEIYISGASVARGYINDPVLTSERFIGDHLNFSKHRLYKTGDLARLLPDGEIEFRGRSDNQVKIRGYRIELDEIAAVLDEHPAIQASAVVCDEESSSEKLLLAFFTSSDRKLTRSTLQEFLRRRLPDYMIPSIFIVVDALPCNSNGKIDRTRLPEPTSDNIVQDEVLLKPRNRVEQQLSEIVSRLLHLDQVAMDDNFFLLGGHSLLGTQLIARIRETFGVDIPLRNLFNAPTIAELASEVQSRLHS